MKNRYLVVAASLVLAACAGADRTEIRSTQSNPWEAGFQGTEALSGAGATGTHDSPVTHALLVDVRGQVQGQLPGGRADPTDHFYQRGKLGSGD